MRPSTTNLWGTGNVAAGSIFHVYILEKKVTKAALGGACVNLLMSLQCGKAVSNKVRLLSSRRTVSYDEHAAMSIRDLLISG